MMIGPAAGMPPLERVQKENLAAAEILVGRVADMIPPPPPFRRNHPELQVFVLQVSHVVKSNSRIQAHDKVAVLFAREGQGSTNLGVVPVRVEPGDLVIVYANPEEQDGHRMLKPVWAGLSVVRLDCQRREEGAVRFPRRGSEHHVP